MTIPASNYQQTKLKNGLRLLTVPLQGVDSVTVLILVRVGSRYETAQLNGISHFLEHIFSKGSAKRPTPLDISVEIDRIGGAHNAYTAKDHSGYYVKSASAHLPLAMDILTDMLLRPRFDPEEIEKEKGVIIEEINFRNDTPTTRIGDYFEELLYGDHPLGWTIDGRVEVVKGLSRKDFINYLKKYYLPRNMVVTVAGHLDLVQTEKLVAENFASQPEGKLIKPDLVQDSQSSPQVSCHPKKTDQVHLVFGVRAYPIDHPQHYPAVLLTTILGRGLSSRLFIEVREKRGLAYYISSHLEEYAETGYLASRAGVDQRRLEEAVKVITAEHAKLAQNQVDDDELSKAKEYLKGRMILALEDSMTVASSYATQALLQKKIETPEEILKKLDQVTAQEIQAVAQEIFVSAKANLALIGHGVDEGRLTGLITQAF